MCNDYIEYLNCTIRQLLERHFDCEKFKICDDTTKIVSPCGCIAYHTYDDTIGFRQNDYSINCSNCLLKKYNNNNTKGESER